jgi:hypothetical protein
MTTLSRRNLLTLLYKVQTHGYGFIRKPDGDCIRAESDTHHYQGREPGTSSDPMCEEFIQRMETYLDAPSLAKQVYELTTTLWYDSVNSAAGPPGPAGPSSDEEYNQTRGYLLGALKALEDILERTDA